METSSHIKYEKLMRLVEESIGLKTDESIIEYFKKCGYSLDEVIDNCTSNTSQRSPQTGKVRDLFKQCKEVEQKESDAILKLKELSCEIESEIERRGLLDDIHYELFEISNLAYDTHDNEVLIYHDNHIKLMLIAHDYLDEYSCDIDWNFTYYNHWDDLSVPEIVDEIVNKSNKLFEVDRREEVSSLEKQAKLYGYKLVKVEEGVSEYD